jgi:Arc/MetJ family transcription regulator
MATNLALDPKLLERALKLSGQSTKKAAVTLALEEFVARRSQKKILDLMGSLEWDDSYDHKAGRSRS